MVFQPHSGSHSPTQVRIDERNLAVLQMLNVNIGLTEMAAKQDNGTLLEGESSLKVITNVYGLVNTVSFYFLCNHHVA